MMNLHAFVVLGIFFLFSLLVFNFITIFNIKSGLIKIDKLVKKPKLEIISIEVECEDCFDIDEIISRIENSEVNITKKLTLGFFSKEAKKLIDKYEIKKLPAIILRGEIDKISIQGFRRINDSLILDSINPPWIDAETGKVVGKVSAIILKDSNCEICYDFSELLQNLKQSIVFSKIESIDFNSSRGKKIIQKYGIEKIPSLILSKDIEVYSIAQNLIRVARLIKNYYILETRAPYVEADSGKLRGLVKLVMITDNSCEECYDVRIHKQILERFGLAIIEEKIVEISSKEGKALIEKYKITKVPTIILVGDVQVYTNFNSVWQQVGTIEKDGSYVFREMDALGNVVYKDLLKNKIIK